MKKPFVIAAALALVASFPLEAAAESFSFTFGGAGVSGSVVLTYGAATDAKYPQAFEITGVTGTFSDSNNGLGLVNVPITSLMAINRAAPEPTNLLAPNDFSRFAVASGLSPVAHDALTYDNLFYPGGSPQTATDYPVSGGFFDIYGLMFDIGGGRVVDLWSNGVFGAGAPADYGVAVATHDLALDYVEGGVSTAVAAVPEPSTYAFMLGGLGVVGGIARRRKARA